MIYTCTFNPSVDYKMEADEFHIGILNRVNDTAFYPGGKGINVSRVLKNFKTSNVALGFLGGFTGKYIYEQLEAEGLTSDFIFHDGPTRINIKLKSINEETEINGNGAVISQECQIQLLQKIKNLSDKDYLVLAGSLPSSLSFDYFEEIALQCQKIGISTIIDTSGPKLKKLLKYSPFLIKPNRVELEEVLERELKSIDELILGGKYLLSLGAKNIIISLGGDGALFINKNLVLFAPAPKGKVVSTVGSGDSMVAGFLSAFLKTKDPYNSFKYSVAAGSATAFSDDLCTQDAVLQLLSQIQIKEL